MLPCTGSLPVFLTAATIGEAKGQGREHSQGWGRARGLCTYVTLMPRDALHSTVYGLGRSLDSPARLQDPGDYAGLFSYAGPDSNSSTFK